MPTIKVIKDYFGSIGVNEDRYKGLKSKDLNTLYKKVQKIEDAYNDVLDIEPTTRQIEKILKRNIDVDKLKDRLRKKV